MRIVRRDLFSAWRALLGELLTNYEFEVAPRGLRSREILSTQLRFPMEQNIIVCPTRNLNYRFAVAEWLWMWFGRDDVDSLARYIPSIKRFSDDGRVFAGAYGPRLKPQWPYILDTLNRDRDTRQAVSLIWKPSPVASKDTPCTLTLQFLRRQGKLYVIANMRSSDTWLGLTYDCFAFSQLGNIIASMLRLDRGDLIMNLGSSHLYECDWEKARLVALDSASGSTLRSPALASPPDETLEMLLVDPSQWLRLLTDPTDIHYANVLRATDNQEALRELDILASL